MTNLSSLDVSYFRIFLSLPSLSIELNAKVHDKVKLNKSAEFLEHSSHFRINLP